MVDGQLRWPPEGETRGTAVLLHGMMSLGATWWRIGPALAADGWDVLALDMAGHGAAPPVGGPLTLDVLVERVLSAVPWPVDLLVGHSLGGATAVAVAAREPGLARALVLEDPPNGRSDAADPASGRSDAEEERARGVERDVATDRRTLLARSTANNPGWAAEDVEHDVEGIEHAQADAIVAGLRGGHWRWDLPALVRAVYVPVLVLAAAEERSALSGGVRAAVRAALPADRFVELPGGHGLHRDSPDRWLDEIRGFSVDTGVARR